MNEASARLPLALTMGDPAGIGGEIALKAWLALRGRIPFMSIDDPERMRRSACALRLDVPVAEVASPSEAVETFPRALPVMTLRLAKPVRAGEPDAANAPVVVESIDRAVALVSGREVAGVVTNPIHKEILLTAGFAHAGHTEYLAELSGGSPVEMMLVCPGLRVVPMTVHVPLRAAIERVSRARVTACVRRTAQALTNNFGIARPRLVVAGLNPHAGEGGKIGSEDLAEIAPAVAQLREEGVDVRGPLPADSLFHAEARAGYDAAICMYHDQALIPIKTVDFWNGVNVTLGLPFVRTSPDHGTAFDIAGRGIARADSLVAALRLAAELAERRIGLGYGG